MVKLNLDAVKTDFVRPGDICKLLAFVQCLKRLLDQWQILRFLEWSFHRSSRRPEKKTLKRVLSHLIVTKPHICSQHIDIYNLQCLIVCTFLLSIYAGCGNLYVFQKLF